MLKSYIQIIHNLIIINLITITVHITYSFYIEVTCSFSKYKYKIKYINRKNSSENRIIRNN